MEHPVQVHHWMIRAGQAAWDCIEDGVENLTMTHMLVKGARPNMVCFILSLLSLQIS